MASYSSNDQYKVNRQRTTTYTYDDAGFLTEKTDVYHSFTYNGTVNDEKVDHTVYTNDDQGRVTQFVTTYGITTYSDGSTATPSSVSLTVSYTYGDYYFFDIEG